jgi:hypothetical protein
VNGRRLVIEPEKRPRYTLDELLAQCDRRARPASLFPWLERAQRG